MKKSIVGIVLMSGILFANFSGSAQGSKLTVYRKGAAYGSLAKYKVNVDQKDVTTLKNNAIYSMNVAPGQHMVAPKQEKRGVNINVKPGENYVVVYKTHVGLFGGRPKLKVMTESEAKGKYKYFREHADQRNAM